MMTEESDTAEAHSAWAVVGRACIHTLAAFLQYHIMLAFPKFYGVAQREER